MFSQENPGYSRTRKHRRPQLSESEDGDTSASLQPGGGSLNYGRNSHTLPGRGRGQVMLSSDWLSLIILTSDWLIEWPRGRRYCGEMRQCSPSQEPVHAAQARHQGGHCEHQNEFITCSFQESSGQYWGLAFPLNPQVLLPSDPVSPASVPPPACGSCPMPLQLSKLFTNSQYQHEPGQCLKCYDVKVRSSLSCQHLMSLSPGVHQTQVLLPHGLWCQCQ